MLGLHAIAQTVILLPLVFGNDSAAPAATVEPVKMTRYEASNIVVQADSSFSLEVDGNIYGGCLPRDEDDQTSPCKEAGMIDDITLFEDGSVIWQYDTEAEIVGCFYVSWGCSVDNMRARNATK